MRKTTFQALSGAAIVAGFVLTLLSGPALAGQCVYSDGREDDGPCVEVRNELSVLNPFASYEMNLWCHTGPTARSHKIILRPNPDSFTCRGVPGIGTGIRVQRTQAGCDTCVRHFSCEGKLVLKLDATHSGEELIVKGCTTK